MALKSAQAGFEYFWKDEMRKLFQADDAPR